MVHALEKTAIYRHFFCFQHASISGCHRTANREAQCLGTRRVHESEHRQDALPGGKTGSAVLGSKFPGVRAARSRLGPEDVDLPVPRREQANASDRTRGRVRRQFRRGSAGCTAARGKGSPVAQLFIDRAPPRLAGLRDAMERHARPRARNVRELGTKGIR